MKFLRADGGQFELEMNPGEHGTLLHLLKLYPLVPESYHRLTKDKKLPHREENQRLLDDALRSQREQNKKEIFALLNAPARFQKISGGGKVTFTRAELEWLLQIVNDVRVGSWIAMGSPGYATEQKIQRNVRTMPHLMFMELAGAFEMFFLGVINGSLRPGDEE